MALPTDKLYVPATAAELRDDFLADVRIEARKYADEDQVDRVTRPGTDWYILATAIGNLGILQYSNITKADKNANILTATGESLDAFREALGLPEVNPAPATGKLVVTVLPAGALANFNNNEFVLPNGKRGRVDGVHIGIADQGEVPVVTIDTGSDCNLPSTTVVRFVAPPPNAKSEAKVSVNAPLTGGADAETDERKRDRILNRLQTVPAGGNWGYCIEQALNALASVQYAFVYPALGGPGSAKVVVVKDFDFDNYDFTRTLGSAAVSIVRDALHATMPDDIELVVSAATATTTNVSVFMTLPAAAAAGGNGQGWENVVPWPPITTAPYTPASITAVSSDGTQITVNAITAVSPIAGQTRISWWSSVDQKFYSRLVSAVSGMAGAWVLTLDAALFDHNNNVAQVGEYISPAAVNIQRYGQAWLESIRRLGPGENTADAFRLPRSLRRPFAQEDWFSGLTAKQITQFLDSFSEISDAAWAYRSLSAPPVPGGVATAPIVLVPGHFAIYKQ